ncbi:MAG: YkgJ family cysteine cluster protein [Candidatus Thorarchaeota archaeon]|nr:MAG: YkgJ family cysteine cluster protein [Candidatus Thorarchaeota archaeon]
MGASDPESPSLEGSGVRFECTKCGACCRQDELLVTVTASDIVRLGAGLGLNAIELTRALDFYVLDSEPIPHGLRHIPRILTERGLAYVALRKLENGDCVFLKDDICMIHSIRPAVCRSFPFVFRAQDKDMKWGLSAMKDICPGLGQGEEVPLNYLRDLGSSVLSDLASYSKLAQRWNKTGSELSAIDYIIYAIESLSEKTRQ